MQLLKKAEYHILIIVKVLITTRTKHARFGIHTLNSLICFKYKSCVPIQERLKELHCLGVH